MKTRLKVLLVSVLASITINANAQNFSSLSGTVRLSCGWVGDAVFSAPVYYIWLTRLGLLLDGEGTFSGWIRQNHNTFLRFFNVGYDFHFPQWTMASANNTIELMHPFGKNYSKMFEFFEDNNYIHYIGYHFNWRDPFSRLGFYAGADYEWRNFAISYQPEIDAVYRLTSHNEIHSIVPAAGVRFKLISPEKEIDGFPINVVLEAGLSYAIAIKYNNDKDYGTDALNNGFRANVGVHITTNKYGSIHVRWNKDLYKLYNSDYVATDGFLANEEISNSFSCFSVGWASFF